MGENLKDIKQTAGNAVEIVRQLSSPEFQASLDKIKLTSNNAKEIMELLREPALVKNIENIRMTAEAFQSVSSKFENIFSNNMLSSPSNNELFVETIKSISEMVTSMRQLIDELRFTVGHSKTSGLVRDVNETIQNASDAYADIKRKP
ncbi:MAG TPA: hypothetical protein VE089_06275 [Nitrososphaeraceae archaeon]|jgi:hypothetical protein|nr:hypothetical protein [Nitrososphaeraceae archaeon]